MPDTDQRSLQERLDQIEARLAALADLGLDTAPVAGRLGFARGHLAEGRLTDAAAVLDETEAEARRIASGGSEPGTEVRRRSRGPDLAAEVRRLLTGGLLQECLAELQARPDPLAAARESLRLEELRAGLARELADQVRTALRDLPAPPAADAAALAKLQDGVLAEVEWRIERIAAERGWCSLGDVQVVVNKALAHTTPATANSSLPNFSRLEAALSEFVNQTQRQQERFVLALQERVERQASSLSQSPSAMVAREAGPVLSPESPTTIQPAAQAGQDSNLHPTPDFNALRQQEARPSTDAIGDTGLAAVAAQLPGQSPLPPPVESTEPDSTEFFGEVETRDGFGPGHAPTVKVATGASPAPGPSSSTYPAIAAAVGEQRTRELIDEALAKRLGAIPVAEPASGSLTSPEGLRRVLDEELDRRLAAMPGLDDVRLRQVLVRLLPEVLREERVRTSLFALLATEAVANPGALGELTGLRNFLKRELDRLTEAVPG